MLFHTCRAVTGSDASFDVVWLVTTAIPKLIETAGRCHADGAWVFLPGWATLPIIAAGFLWGRRRLLDLADASTRRWASPLSWVVLPFMLAGPVLNKGMGELTVVVAATWMVPAVGLACLLPILRPSSEMPIYWAGVAFAGAALIASWALFSFGELDWSRMVLAAVAVCIVIAIGFLIDRKVAVTDMWPLLALTICMGAIGIAQPLQSLTFDHALKTIHILSNNASSELPPLLEFYSPEARARQPVRDPKSYYPEYAKPEPIKEVASPQAIRMELALVGAMSFWLTLAILAAWRLADQTAVRKHDMTPIE